MRTLTAEEKRVVLRRFVDQIDSIIDECVASEDLAKKRKLEIEQLEREVQGMSETWTSPEATERLEKEIEQLLEAADYHMTTAMELRKENEKLKEENECTDPSYWLLKDAEREIERLKEEIEELKDGGCVAYQCGFRDAQNGPATQEAIERLEKEIERLKEELNDAICAHAQDEHAHAHERNRLKEENEELTKRVNRLNHFMAGLRFEVERLS